MTTTTKMMMTRTMMLMIMVIAQSTSPIQPSNHPIIHWSTFGLLNRGINSNKITIISTSTEWKPLSKEAAKKKTVKNQRQKKLDFDCQTILKVYYDILAEEFGIRREETPNIALTSLLLITFPQQNPTVMTANNCHYFHVPKS